MVGMNWQDGHCATHGRYKCGTCKRAEAASWDYGVFVWREDGCYPRSEALSVYKTRKAANRSADLVEGAVVRTLVRVS